MARTLLELPKSWGMDLKSVAESRWSQKKSGQRGCTRSLRQYQQSPKTQRLYQDTLRHHCSLREMRISLRLNDPEFQSKTPAWITIAQFLEFIRQQVGPTVYWDGRLRENERGQIRIQSLPAAGIILDGVRLGVKSPVQSLYVASGHHHVELIHPQTAQKWSYRVFVKAGATTVLKVELK